LTGLLRSFSEPMFWPSAEYAEALTGGPRSMVHTLQVIPRCFITSAIFCIKVDQSTRVMTSLLIKVSSEGDCVGAEPHLLASGTRDSARLLAQVYFEWAKASNSLESHAGIFALRGTLPYALPSHIHCCDSLCVDTCSTATFSLHAPFLRALSPASHRQERPFLWAPAATRS